MRLLSFPALASGLVVLATAACSSGPAPDPGVGASSDALSGCNGTASSTVPSSGSYYLTSFGNTPSDNGTMSCGESTDDGTWYYAASRQRYGCGSRIQITANGKCVVAETDDYGPDVCVENAAGRPIIDASPLVSEHLFGTSSAGWSDQYAIEVTEVAKTTPLGICDGNPSGGSSGGSPSPAGCYSGTLGKDMPANACVQSTYDDQWYQCDDGNWVDRWTDPDACDGVYPL
ncbi:MAG TPA: hypothetical protein VIJ22_13315 [Polyangiaceae bacterium]